MAWVKQFVLRYGFLLTIVIILLGIAVYPLYRKNQLKPTGTIYTLAQVRYGDFYIYEAVMGQGARGFWTADHPFVNEPHQRTLVYFFFILLGKIAAVMHIQAGLFYHLTILIELVAFFLSVWWLLRKLLPVEIQKITLILIFFAGTFPIISWNTSFPSFTDVWLWSLQWESPYHRLTHVPHHTMAEILLIISVIFLVRFMQQRKFVYVLFAGLLQIPAVIFFPAPTIGLVTAFFLSLYIWVTRYWKKERKNLPVTILSTVFFSLLCFLPLFILRSQLGSGYPWNLEESTGGHNYIMEGFSMGKEYLLMFGPLLFFIPFAFQKKLFTHFGYLFVFMLFITPPLLFFIIPFLGVPAWRVVNIAPFVWGGILAALGIEHMDSWFGRYFRKTQIAVRYWFVAILVLLISAPQATYYWWRETIPVFQHQIYIPQAGMEALLTADRTAGEGDVLLTLQDTGIIVPAITKLKAFLSIDPWTKDFGIKNSQTRKFYSGVMPEAEAKTFIRQHTIRYVFIGWQERYYYTSLSYSFLHVLYEKDGMYLYQVRI